jgi:hypothetical protein
VTARSLARFALLSLLGALGCAPEPGEAEPGAERLADVATPVIRRFGVAPRVIDRNVPTALTFAIELAPWSGAPVVCKVNNGVGVLSSGVLSAVKTVTLTLAQTTSFTVTCKSSHSGAAVATRTVRALPAVTGPEPSPKAVIFYYPWYGNPQTDGTWVHWGDAGAAPPVDITSRYYPALGPYSSNDPDVLAQHFAWIRRAGVGVAALSWWGPDTFEDRAIARILDEADRYRVKIALHVEPYGGRSAETLAAEMAAVHERFGDHPAFFRSTGTSRHNPSTAPKPVYFLWSPNVDYVGGTEVDADYWREAVNTIHGSAAGGLVLAHGTDPSWVDGGHFDGIYNYGSLELDPTHAFDWSRGLPPGAWYVPSVMPGAVFWTSGAPWPPLPRRNGATYTEQWAAALGTSVEPELVSITSFNEWHEGTQIEPLVHGMVHGNGIAYENFLPLAPDAYLDRTSDEVNRFVKTDWLPGHAGRVVLRTTSDWTVLRLVSGAGWMRPEVSGASPSAITAGMEFGRLVLIQPIEDAKAGKEVRMNVDLRWTGLGTLPGPVLFAVERGHLGSTTVNVANATSGTPVVVATHVWGGIAPDPQNTSTFTVPVGALLP